MPTLPPDVTAIDLANLAAVLTRSQCRATNGPEAIEMAAELYRRADAYIQSVAPLPRTAAKKENAGSSTAAKAKV
jgi:hypothetical protein